MSPKDKGRNKCTFKNLITEDFGYRYGDYTEIVCITVIKIKPKTPLPRAYIGEGGKDEESNICCSGNGGLGLSISAFVGYRRRG